MRKFLLISAALFAINLTAQDSLSVKAVQPGIYFDYGKAIGSLDADALKIEGAVDVILKDKWQVVGEYGYWNMKPSWAIENGDYHVRGNYIRFGFGYIPKLNPESRIGIGVRYAASNFQDKGTYSFENDIQPTITEKFQRTEETANWYEVVMYSDKDVNKWLTMGFTFRLRFGLDYQSYEPVDIVTIPGYGRAQDKIVPAVNLFMKVSF